MLVFVTISIQQPQYYHHQQQKQNKHVQHYQQQQQWKQISSRIYVYLTNQYTVLYLYVNDEL